MTKMRLINTVLPDLANNVSMTHILFGIYILYIYIYIYTHTKKYFLFLKLKFNWFSCVSSGNTRIIAFTKRRNILIFPNHCDKYAFSDKLAFIFSFHYQKYTH